MRCAVVAPKLEHGTLPRLTQSDYAHISHLISLSNTAFTKVLHGEGWDVHTQIEEPEGAPLEDFNDCATAREAEMLRALQAVDDAHDLALLCVNDDVARDQEAVDAYFREWQAKRWATPGAWEADRMLPRSEP